MSVITDCSDERLCLQQPHSVGPLPRTEARGQWTLSSGERENSFVEIMLFCTTVFP